MQGHPPWATTNCKNAVSLNKLLRGGKDHLLCMTNCKNSIQYEIADVVAKPTPYCYWVKSYEQLSFQREQILIQNEYANIYRKTIIQANRATKEKAKFIKQSIFRKRLYQWCPVLNYYRKLKDAVLTLLASFAFASKTNFVEEHHCRQYCTFWCHSIIS